MVDILLSFLPSDTVQKLSDLYERCDHEKAEIVGHYVLPSASYGG